MLFYKMVVLIFLLRIVAAYEHKKPTNVPIEHGRIKRTIIGDILQKMIITKKLLTNQYSDTRNTLNDIYNIVNEQLSDPGPVKPTNQPRLTTENMVQNQEDHSSDQTTSTTESYTISRFELGRILGRNFRGIQRLANIELKDAVNATHNNLKAYQAEAAQQFANSLAAVTKKKLNI